MVSYPFTDTITLYDLSLTVIIEYSINMMRAIVRYIIVYARRHD